MGLRLDLHVLRESVGMAHVGRESPDGGRGGGVGVHGVGGWGLVIVKVSSAVDRWFRRMRWMLLLLLLLLLIQR